MKLHLQDGLGSVRAVADDSAALTQIMDFSPYGVPQSSYGTGFGFTGEYTDANDLLYLRARYYAPEMGLFTALDVYEGDFRTPTSLGRYTYVMGNPVNFDDPSGFTPETDRTACDDDYSSIECKRHRARRTLDIVEALQDAAEYVRDDTWWFAESKASLTVPGTDLDVKEIAAWILTNEGESTLNDVFAFEWILEIIHRNLARACNARSSCDREAFADWLSPYTSIIAAFNGSNVNSGFRQTWVDKLLTEPSSRSMAMVESYSRLDWSENHLVTSGGSGPSFPEYSRILTNRSDRPLPAYLTFWDSDEMANRNPGGSPEDATYKSFTGKMENTCYAGRFEKITGGNFYFGNSDQQQAAFNGGNLPDGGPFTAWVSENFGRTKVLPCTDITNTPPLSTPQPTPPGVGGFPPICIA